MKIAVLGIGSNSVRMLFAAPDADGLHRLYRDREGTRLFAGLDEAGNLSEEAMTTTIAAVSRMAARARADGAELLRLFATSAMRDAANSAVFAERLRAACGLTPDICSGEEEARLSFIGAGSGARQGMIDIGGGSTELVVGQGERLECAFSCQMGAVRLFRLMPIARAQDVSAVIAAAAAILEQSLQQHRCDCPPTDWIGVGGTCTSLAALVQNIPWTMKERIHGAVITHSQAQETALRLADMPLAAREALPGLQPRRADIIVHGIAILLAVMERFGIERITVSEAGNLDGYLKQIAASLGLAGRGSGGSTDDPAV